MDRTGETPLHLHTYRCAGCGGVAIWQARLRHVGCVSCGVAVDLPPADAGAAVPFPLVPFLRDSPENRRVFTRTRVERPCPTCHATVVYEPGIASTTCLACGTPLQRPRLESDAPLAPNAVLPFRLSEAEARERIRAWSTDVSGGNLGPARMDLGPLRPVYLPYWRFSIHVHCAWRTEVEWTDSGGERHREVRSGEVEDDLEEIEPAASSVPASLLEALAPLALDTAVPFDPRYLAGATVEQYAVSLWDAWDGTRARFNARIDSLLRKDARTWTVPDETWPSWSKEVGTLALVPLYVGSYRARGQPWQLVVHGTTGKVAGTAPLNKASLARALAVLVVLLALAVLLVWGVVWLVGVLLT